MSEEGDDELWEADPSTVNQSADEQSTNQSIDQSNNQSIDQSTTQSIDQSSNQSVEQSTNQSIDQSTDNKSTEQSLKKDTVITVTSDGLKRKRKTEDVEAAKQRKLNPPNPLSRISQSTPLFEHINPSDQREIQSVILGHFFPNSKNPRDSQFTQLPGPQPKSMTRGELNLLVKGDYWVCEKSDGERAVLFIHRETQSVYCVDRKFDMRRMNRAFAPVLVKLFAQNGDTLLDAELIEQPATQSINQPITYLSIFDVIVFDGLRVADWNFGGEWDETNASDGTGRMDVIMNKVRAPYKQLIDSCIQNQSDPTGDAVRLMDQQFKMIVKEFVAKHHVDRILDRVTIHPSTTSKFFNEHIYSHGGRTNSNDGLIFTPDRDNYFNKHIPLLKWKWPDLNTIDFKIFRPFYDEKGLVLHVRANTRSNGPNIRPVDVIFDYIAELDQNGRGLMDQIESKKVDSAVVECGYSRIDSQWHLKNIRWDKSQPNFQTTVIGTIKSVCDDIGQEDIKKACKQTRFNYRRKRT